MSDRYFFTSMSRISDLPSKAFDVQPLAREKWATGDYVVGEVRPCSEKPSIIELTTGRMVEVLPQDLVVGVFGVRKATLEAVGGWQHIESDGKMEALTEGGLFGKATSVAYPQLNLPPLVYRGHVVREVQKVCMKDFVAPLPAIKYQCPTILMMGTSMSSGKTTTAKMLIRLLKQMELKVVGAKLAGAGQYHDILSMQDAGADKIYDFVDVGIPSSVCAKEDYRSHLRQLLTRIASVKPDVVVAEIGASPFEPYNGDIVLEEIKEQICLTILCAIEPYAVFGAIDRFHLQPDIISGLVTETTAKIALVEKFTGIKTLSLSNYQSQDELRELLTTKLVG